MGVWCVALGRDNLYPLFLDFEAPPALVARALQHLALGVPQVRDAVDALAPGQRVPMMIGGDRVAEIDPRDLGFHWCQN